MQLRIVDPIFPGAASTAQYCAFFATPDWTRIALSWKSHAASARCSSDILTGATHHLAAMTDSKLFLVGATHRSAPFSFREKIALGPEAEAALAVDLKRIAGLCEFVILNTCNRVEIYAVGARNSAMRDVVTTFCGQRGVAQPDFVQFGFVQQDREVVEHLCQVASGLDSQILGETEIFGQAKRAYAIAQ